MAVENNTELWFVWSVSPCVRFSSGLSSYVAFSEAAFWLAVAEYGKMSLCTTCPICFYSNADNSISLVTCV